jgi:hypothetical protein
MACALAAALAGCGGGDTPRDGAAGFAERVAAQGARAPVGLLAAAPRERAANHVVPDAATLFDWAEYKYPALFPKGPQNQPLTYEGVTYTARAYSNGNYLGLTAGGEIYGYGPFTSFIRQGFGTAAQYGDQVAADTCNVYPERCHPQPTGPYNECVDSSENATRTGATWRAEYENSGGSTGGYTIESVIDGPASFGQRSNVIQATVTVSGTSVVAGLSSSYSSKTKSYFQRRSDGLIEIYGSDNESTTGAVTVGGITVGGQTSISRTVFDPPDPATQFVLRVGENVTKTVSSTTTTSQPPGVAPSTASTTSSWTFEERQTITVLGKDYDTCRYRIAQFGSAGSSVSWFIVGKGVTARTESMTEGVLSRTELKSGTYNGAPL